MSDQAYEKLAEWGVPIQKYVEQERDEATGLYKPQPLNDGEVIFDRDLTPPDGDGLSAIYWKYRDRGITPRYWDSWISENRTHPLLLRVVEELGEAANGKHAELEIVEIPDGIDWEISEYDGMEKVEEVHRSWG